MTATMITGTSVVVSPARLADFAQCPPSVRELVDQMVQKHKDHYEGLLKNKADFRLVSGQGQGSEPPPGTLIQTSGSPGTTNEEDAANPINLPQLESEKALREALGEKFVESKIFASNACKIFCTEEGDCYLLPKESYTMAKNTLLAGIGAGKVANDPSGSSAGVELLYPQGDRSYIEVTCGGSSEDDNMVKMRKGTAYAVFKEIQASNPQPLKVTGFEVAVRQTVGSHGYDLSAIGGERWFFVPRDKTVSNVTSGSVARAVAMKQKGLHEAISWVWRFQHDVVFQKLTAKKAFLCTTRPLVLTKDVPVKLTTSSA